jgi:mannose-1-phosphate guanylyltransferase
MNVMSIVLAGGSGKRLWPLSTARKPKQLLEVSSDHTLLEAALKRAHTIAPFPCMVTTASFKEQVEKTVPRIVDRVPFEWLIEPDAKNTAPALLLAALNGLKKNPDMILCSFPADHLIDDEPHLAQVIHQGIGIAQSNGSYVLVGIVPHEPLSSLGYIIPEHRDTKKQKIRCFIEKPNTAQAEFLMQEGALWNSGILIAPAKLIVNTIKKTAPDIYAAVSAFMEMGDVFAYNRLPKIPIEKVLHEQLNGYVISAHCGWHDVGKLEHFLAATKSFSSSISVAGNANQAWGTSKPVVFLGVDNTTLIETEMLFLVVSKPELFDIQEVIEHLHTAGYQDLL